MNASNDTGLRELTGPPLGSVVSNVATLLRLNALRHPKRIVFRERRGDQFVGPDWRTFYDSVGHIAAGFAELGLQSGDRVAIVSTNRLEMLKLQLAVMSSGAIAVPVFHGYPRRVLSELIEFCGARFVAAGRSQLDRIDPALALDHVIALDDETDCRFDNLIAFTELGELSSRVGAALRHDADPHAVCLMQYTSGTTGTPKCVQLTHGNILSQRVALDSIWSEDEPSRLLSYLPWHHSFGGIFELFNALARTATITLEPSLGKDTRSIVEMWKLVKPTMFFSVPRVFQALVEAMRDDEAARAELFHPDLSFIFTAAAPLPERVAHEFEAHGVRIVEGWGLTETSPCCTIASGVAARVPSVVGTPIAGVSLRIADDGEIQVRGPNVMPGYHHNPIANAAAFTDDEWFRTGDIGVIESEGLRLVGRRDRIFKLSNGEKVISAELEHMLQSACHYLEYAVVEGSGRSYPVALLFPNRQLLNGCSRIGGCECPRTIEDLARCLGRCLSDANSRIVQKYSRLPIAILADDELTIENGRLTPSMKVISCNVDASYRTTIESIYADEPIARTDVIVIPLRTDGVEE